jgi:phospholipid/cholesterol/gamma-HCH transport system substrate-binding protein
MPNTIKVGIFMTIALLVLAWLIIRVEDFRLFGERGVRVEALFDTVTGLDDRSAVRIAGVRVGRVDGIDLEDNQAVVGILLDEPLLLTRGTRARIASLGLLGDKYVELVPGPRDAPPLAEDARIPGTTAPGFDEVLGSFADFGTSMEKLAGQLTGELELEGPMGRMVFNLEATTGELRQLVAANRAQLDATIANFQQVSATLAAELPRISGELQAVLADIGVVTRDIGGVVGENREAVRASLHNVEELTLSLRAGVENLNQVSARLARGEGTLGKLLTSEELHDQLVGTLDSVAEGVDALGEAFAVMRDIRIDLDLHGFYLESQDTSQGAFQIDLDTQSGMLYRLGIVDGPKARERREREVITVIEPDGTSTTREIETVTFKEDITFSALLGLPLGDDVRVWTGLLQSRFGLQLDYQPSEHWSFSVESFAFDRRAALEPHLRFSAAFKPRDRFYLLGGYDDVLNSERSFFVGAGFTWRDDSLKYLLGSLPSL